MHNFTLCNFSSWLSQVLRSSNLEPLRKVHRPEKHSCQVFSAMSQSMAALDNQATSMPKPPYILKLPEELLAEIFRVCDFNGKISFRLTCRQFYKTLGTSLSVLFWFLRPCSLPAQNLRFEYFCLDESYFCTRSGNYMCSVCKEAHPRCDFSETEITKDPKVRVCNGSLRRLHLMPGATMSHHDIQCRIRKSSSKKIPIENFEPDEGSALAVMEGVQWVFHELNYVSNQRSTETSAAVRIRTPWAIATTWAVRLDSAWEWQTILRRKLQERRFQLCSHLRSDSEDFLQPILAIHPANQYRVRDLKCPHCATSVSVDFQHPSLWKAGSWAESGRCVEFLVTRHLGYVMDSATDPRWIQQSVPGFVIEN